MNDDFVLQAIAFSGRRAPNGEDERRQYLRLIDEGYLRRIPVKPLPGDTNDPLICELTVQGRQKIGHRSP
jgi:hypothetical protein